MFSLVALCSLVCLANAGWNPQRTSEALKDQVTDLPGLPKDNNFTQFAGYITVDEANNRSLFYWFVEALNDPKSAPVALWTNGGPGCSGLLGMLTENGPFWATADGLALEINPYSWVNKANMIWFEQPAGVGFSFSDVTSDYNTGDAKAAADNDAFIRGWLTKFPEYKSNEFFITSESYGGHYMPTLAKQIVVNNKAGKTPEINFGGLFVGNPYTDPLENSRGAYDTYYGHNLVPRPVYQEWYNNCGEGERNTPRCLELEGQMSGFIGDLDPYALDFPVCNGLDGRGKMHHYEKYWTLRHLHRTIGRPMPPIYKKMYGENLRDNAYEPCAENFETVYLSRNDVQEAIHAKHRTTWTGCGGVNYNGTDSAVPMETYYQWLTDNAPKVRKTIVSGDDDSVCGGLGTQSWLFNMGWTYDSNNDTYWQTWMLDGQVAGYVTKFYNGTKEPALTLVTVHTAGHMIPQTQPARSLEAFTRFLSGEF